MDPKFLSLFKRNAAKRLREQAKQGKSKKKKKGRKEEREGGKGERTFCSKSSQDTTTEGGREDFPVRS